jgi:hypothetical protein
VLGYFAKAGLFVFGSGLPATGIIAIGTLLLLLRWKISEVLLVAFSYPTTEHAASHS